MSRGPGRPPIPTEDLIESLRGLAELVGGRPKVKHVDAFGEYGRQPYYDRFGSWGSALDAAGVDHQEPASLKVPAELERHPAAANR